MLRRRAFAACALACAQAVEAEISSVARLAGISGNVLVREDSVMASAGEPRRLAPGARVLVMLDSSATVEYDNGCRVRLVDGDRLEIRSDALCTPEQGSGVHVQAAVHR